MSVGFGGVNRESAFDLSSDMPSRWLRIASYRIMCDDFRSSYNHWARRPP